MGYKAISVSSISIFYINKHENRVLVAFETALSENSDSPCSPENSFMHEFRGKGPNFTAFI